MPLYKEDLGALEDMDRRFPDLPDNSTHSTRHYHLGAGLPAAGGRQLTREYPGRDRADE